MAETIFLTAQEAANELGVSRATLYAYVSRGLVRSEAVGSQPHDRRYRAEDIQRLKDRKELRKNPAKTAEQALSWGIPVLESQLTLISDGRLYYRGRDALELAQQHSLEEVAALLWTGAMQPGFASQAGAKAPGNQVPSFSAGHLMSLNAFQAALIQAESQDPAAFDLQPGSVAAKGLAILHLLARVAVGSQSNSSSNAAQILQAGWIPNNPQAARLIEAAMILCADHELNVSAFTARCVASAGASPYASVIAGLSALQGVKHGGVSRRVAALFEEAGRPDRARVVLSNRLKRGEHIPGFGHPLYPSGDPRAHLLLALIRASAAPEQFDLAEAIAGAAQELIGGLPTVDFALVCLERTLGLPEDAAIMLFAIGRSVGWLAHVIEQYQLDKLIRPRARYTGPQP